MRPQSPCKDCEKRQPGCHASCAEYQAFHEENERFKQWKQESTEPVYIIEKVRRITDKRKKRR